MHPRLWSTPYFTLYTFGVLFALAVLVAFSWLVRAAKRTSIQPELLMSFGLWAIVGGIVGAKLLLLFRSLPESLAQPSQLWSMSYIESAGDFYGGFLGALLGCVIYFWLHPELPAWPAADLCAPAIALGQAIGRIGCFMAGDDYGRKTTVPWAVTFTNPDAARVGGAPLGVPLHPVQLYESLVCFTLFVFLWWLSKRKQFDGEIILSYTALYAVSRFVLEYFRGDADRGFVLTGALSTSQFIAIPVFAVSITLLFIRLRRRMRISDG